MATEKQPKKLNDVLNERRDDAVAADGLEIAEWLWSKIRSKYESFSKFELARMKHINVGFFEDAHNLYLKVHFTDALTGDDEEAKKMAEVIRLSELAMESIDNIMQIVMSLAKANDIESWNDDKEDSDCDFGTGEGDQLWGFLWYNSKYKTEF